jgi:hypothetical protein
MDRRLERLLETHSVEDLLEALRQTPPPPPPRTPKCYSDAELRLLTTNPGVEPIPKPKALQMLKHISMCDHCGPRLKKLLDQKERETCKT